MKKFVSEISLFICATIGITSVIFCLETSIIRHYASFRLPGNTRYVVLGHSHAECALNDTLVPGLKNMAKSSDSYFDVYDKVKEILQQNKSINTIFIEISNNQVDTIINSWMWNDVHMPDKYFKYAPFMEPQQSAILLYHNPAIFPTAIGIAIKKDLLIILKHDYNYIENGSIGGYAFLVRGKIDSLLADSNINHPVIHKSALPVENLEYLSKTIMLCKKQGVRVCLVRVPVHSKWSYLTNELVLKKAIADYCPGVDFLDFKDFPLTQQEYGDLEHLNYRGARKFSVFFNSLLQRGLLDSSNKQAVIDRAMR